jgi:purine-binding chemotaxis protein CheW
VRGRLLTALDLRPLLGLPPAAALPGGLLLIVAVKSVELALYTDAVLDVRRRDNEIAPAPSNSAGSGIAWLLGVDRAFTLLIDPVLLLADPRLIVNTSA